MRWLTSSILLFGLTAFSVQAQTLNMPDPAAEAMPDDAQQMSVQSGQKTQVQSQTTGVPGAYEVDVPGRGMSMSDVEARFGAPLNKVEEVGEPPITRWVYNDFMVYFEYQFVLHAVVTRAAP
ncbi:MAG: hypothetical protein OQK73_05190 [Gammaproteobacteria bacterium]|nr:hypothetical protein [Gammaproteobacteria bacterium]